MNLWQSGNGTCAARVPLLYELRIINKLWQKVPFVDGVFYLLSAHLDLRPSHESFRGKVRVMTAFHVSLRVF